MGHGVQVVPACAWTWGGGIGQSGEKGRKAASTSTPSKRERERETRQETGTDRRNWCDIRLRCSRAHWWESESSMLEARCGSGMDGSRLGQSAALGVSTRAWRAVMERRRSGRRADEMDADGMEQKPNTRNAGRDGWVGGGRTRRRRRERRDTAVCSGKRVLVLRVGGAWDELVGEWRPQGGTRWNAEGPSGGKRRIGKLRCSSRRAGRGREWEREGDEKCSRAVPTLLPARRPGWVKRVPWGKAGPRRRSWASLSLIGDGLNPLNCSAEKAQCAAAPQHPRGPLRPVQSSLTRRRMAHSTTGGAATGRE